MKIRNKRTGAEYSSNTLIDNSEYGEYYDDNTEVYVKFDIMSLSFPSNDWVQVTETHLPCTAISLMHYLDDNRTKDKMCLSCSECEQIDKAWWNNDWRTIINYIKKYCNEDKK